MSGEADEVKWRGVRPVAGIRGVWPAVGAVRVNASSTRDGVGANTIYTPAAGKRLFISGCTVASRVWVGAECYARVWVQDDGDVEQYRFGCHIYNIAGQQVSTQLFVPALEAGPGWDVVSYSSHANMDLRVHIHGWLENDLV